MSTLRAGDLKHRITLRKGAIVRDQAGSPQPTFEIVSTVWSAVEAISNRKIRTLDQGQVVETMMFTIRPRSDVGIDWQVIYRERLFTVRAVDRTLPDRALITAEADTRHDRV
jgi:SPP1 family predicted phage head-tail adaptor